jgi:hypothetical protein
MDKSTVCPSTREWVTCGTLHFMAVRKQRKRETWELLGQDTAGQKTTPVTHFLSAQRHQLGTEHSACEPVGLFCIQTMAQVSGFVLLNHLAFESKRKQKSTRALSHPHPTPTPPPPPPPPHPHPQGFLAFIWNYTAQIQRLGWELVTSKQKFH